jgi:hypothetical protein
MIVKSMSRKASTLNHFGQLLRYINAPQSEKLGQRAVLHNLRATTDDLPAIEREFLNDCRNVQYRRDGIMLFHEIISVAEEDREKVTETMLNDLARHYLRLRAPDAKAYAKAQFDTDNPHIHLMISANRIGSSTKLRLSKFDFGSAKRDLEKFQREKYPELNHSIVFGKTSGQKAGKDPEQLIKTQAEHERERRLRREGRYHKGEKEQVRDKLLTALQTAQSEIELRQNLKTNGFEPYIRGKTAGVRDLSTGKNYRLKTLGLDFQAQEKVRRLRQIPGRESQMKELERELIREQVQQFGFKEDIQDLLATSHNNDRHDPIQRREQQMREALRETRQRNRNQAHELDGEDEMFE